MAFINDLRCALGVQQDALDKAALLVDHGVACLAAVCSEFEGFTYTQQRYMASLTGRSVSYASYPWNIGREWFVVKFWQNTERPGYVTVKTWDKDRKEVLVHCRAEHGLEHYIKQAIVDWLTIGRYLKS